MVIIFHCVIGESSCIKLLLKYYHVFFRTFYHIIMWVLIVNNNINILITTTIYLIIFSFRGNITTLRIPTGKRQTSCSFTCVVNELKLHAWLPRKKISYKYCSSQGETWPTGPPYCKSSTTTFQSLCLYESVPELILYWKNTHSCRG